MLTTNVRPRGDTQARPAGQVPPRPARLAPLTDRYAASAASINGAATTVAVISMALVAVTVGTSG